MTTTQKTLRDSAAIRWMALLLLALAMFCAYIFMDILSPIKDLMQTQRGWDSDAFGTMQGSETFLNVFVFFLIFAGIILDKMGVRFTALLSGGVMLLGAIIKWYAISDSFIGSDLETWFTNNLNHIPVFEQLNVSPFYEGMPASAKLAACGFMLFGCGAEMGGITVSRGIVKWFKGREMALAMGSEMALARLGVATCMIFSPFFAKLGGVVSVSRSVAFGVVLLCIAMIMLVVYFFMDKKLDAQTGEAVGGGMCQFSNLIHWMVLHAPLTITEQHHHDQFDLFPDFGRQVPFGTGTSIFYNYLDYRFRNDTEQTYQLLVHTTPTHLCGELRTDAPLAVKYHIAAEDERFVREDGVVYRCGEVYRTMVDKTTGNVLSRELLRRNHARVLYDTAGLEIMDR